MRRGEREATLEDGDEERGADEGAVAAIAGVEGFPGLEETMGARDLRDDREGRPFLRQFQGEVGKRQVAGDEAGEAAALEEGEADSILEAGVEWALRIEAELFGEAGESAVDDLVAAGRRGAEDSLPAGLRGEHVAKAHLRQGCCEPVLAVAVDGTVTARGFDGADDLEQENGARRDAVAGHGEPVDHPGGGCRIASGDGSSGEMKVEPAIERVAMADDLGEGNGTAEPAAGNEPVAEGEEPSAFAYDVADQADGKNGEEIVEAAAQRREYGQPAQPGLSGHAGSDGAHSPEIPQLTD